tara:strand:+ start:66342 stop:66701 length:360 start_codon:yes stop_codon:yes gene_type:complete
MKSYIALFFLFVINSSYSQIKSKAIEAVSPEEFKKVVLIDVRTPDEFKAGHIADAINVNWFDSNFVEQIEAIVSKEKPVYVYCKAGGRSEKAYQKLEALGYKVTDLKGGYDAYIAKQEK